MSRSRTLAAALVLAAALLAVHLAWTRARHGETYRVRRGELPGFDAYVYVAMAEQPRVFTVSPWGYRLLTPTLVHLLPLRTGLGFRVVTLVGLLTASTCVALLLHRLGHQPPVVALGVALVALSPFVGVFLQNPFLVDPLAVALLAALLLAVESGASLATLALVATLGVAAKEVLLVLAPLVMWGRRDAVGRARAARDAVLVLLPALAFEAVLRLRWPAATPQATLRFDGALVATLAALVARTARHWLLLGGVFPLALVGAFHETTRSYARRYALAALAALVLPLAYTAVFPASVAYLAGELPRYGLYLLPLLVPAAAAAAAWLWPPARAASPSSAAGSSRSRDAAAWAATLGLVALPAVGLDPYRRAELRGRDGERLLALARQGPPVAAALARGETVVLDVDADPFLSVDDARDTPAAAWFLLAGWDGAGAGGGPGEVRMHGREAAVAIPVFVPRDLLVSLTLDAPVDVTLAASVGPERVGSLHVGTAPAAGVLHVPAAALVRGDNVLVLAADAPAAVRVHRVTLEPPR